MKQLMSRFAAFVLMLTAASACLGGAAAAQDAKGDWHGVLDLGSGTSLPLALHLKAGANGMEGTLDNPDRGVHGEPLSDVSVKDDKLSFTGTLQHGTYTGAWDPAAHGWSGVLSVAGHDYPLVFTAGDLPPAPPVAGLDGEWDGALNLGTGIYLRLAFHIATGPRGTLVTYDSVDQGAYGAPASSISRDGDHVRIEMKAIGAVFEGQYAAAGPSLIGVFTQNRAPMPLVLKRLPPGHAPPWPKPAGAGGPVPAPPAN